MSQLYNILKQQKKNNVFFPEIISSIQEFNENFNVLNWYFV